ncbi:flagellar FliJ family protein [bacterium]|nr:flagellar FliJ family protein [bacterium]
MKNQKIKIKNAHTVLKEKRNDLIKATQDRKVLERLKSIGQENYLKEMDRLEQIFLDEAAIIRHSKR